MDEETKGGYNLVHKIQDSFGRFLGIEKPANREVIYRYPKNGETVLLVDLETKEKPFKAWHYSLSSSTDPGNIRTIPENPTRSVINFVPPEAYKAYQKQTEETSWLEDPEFRGKRLSITRNNIAAFADLLNAVKNGELKQTEYIIGETNCQMATLALSLGFRRCWEDGYNQPDLTKPLVDENQDYKVGISVADLIQMYNLENEVATETSVLKAIRTNRNQIAS